MNNLLLFALEYIRQWLVLPLAWITDAGVCGCRLGADCPRPGKHPLTLAGFHDATRDEATIRGWWHVWPRANIGICTGRESGLLVLDVDPRNGGNESLAKLQAQYGELPETLACRTGGAGWHFYFQYPSLIALRGKIFGFPGLDIKGNGGYVVAPPSRHASGGVYRWQTDWRTTAIAPVPEWLLELIRAAEENTDRRVGIAPPWPGAELGFEDREILRQLQKGVLGKQYQLLVEGRWADLYPTQSEADLALFNVLARLTGGNPGRMYATFKETGLMRTSNDKPFSYYARTIQKAIDGLAWTPNRGPQR